jgi:hypothetical protein
MQNQQWQVILARCDDEEGDPIHRRDCGAGQNLKMRLSGLLLFAGGLVSSRTTSIPVTVIS